MIARWTLGFIAGTAIIWLSSPFFVRSYLPRESNRGVLTLPAGEIYRWRSEGYASSRIGRFGMVGQSPLTETPSSSQAVALWGDSQAEGVCVGDEQKIFSLVNAVASSDGNGFTVLPLARSGDNASDWLQQIPFAENELGASAHVFLVTELSDLASAADRSTEIEPIPTKTNTVVSWLPDFAIHAARNLVTQGDGVTLRRLRFSVGPISSSESLPESPFNSHPEPTDWKRVFRSIKQATDRTTIILYAPQLPSVIGNRIVTEDGDQSSFIRLQSVAQSQEIQSQQIQVVDLRDSLRESASVNDWPHGFHNGRIGSGHLNLTGNQIVADAIAQALQSPGHLQPPGLFQKSDR